MTRRPPAREPLFNAPAPALVLVASLVGSYALQSRWPDPDAPVALLGLTPRALAAGQVWRLLTVVLVHGGWAHALMNALGALAFAPPVARRLDGGRGLGFFAFYAVCGIAASLGYVLLHPGGGEVLVGASGAIAGLMGASSRMVERPGGLAPLGSRTVVAMALGWVAINLLMARGLLTVGTDGAPVAWEAHLFGYGAGLVLIGPASRLAERAWRAERQAEADGLHPPGDRETLPRSRPRTSAGDRED